MTVKMNARDAVHGALAECYVTLGENRYNMMQIYEFTSKYEVNLTQVPILGSVSRGNKAAGGKGTWFGTAHYNQSVLRAWLLHYKNTGALVPFDIQVSNEDPTSAAGRQTIIHYGCLLDALVLAKFDSADEVLDEKISGTFDDWDMPEAFAPLAGMQ